MKKQIITIFSLASIWAYAQQKEPKDSLNVQELNEIVITASRKKEDIKEVPTSVTVLNRKEIEEKSLVNPDIKSILANTVPSLANGTYTTMDTGQTLRGRNVLVLIDGIPQSTPLRSGGRSLKTIDPASIQRIEVIKGATSIYGNGADGGIINYITLQPNSKKGLSGKTSLGISGQPFAGTLGVRASQVLQGASGKWDYLASMTFERTGYIKDANGDNLNPFYSLAKMNSYNGMLKVGYNINQNQRIEASYIGYSSRSHLDLGTKIGKYGEKPTIGLGEGNKDPREVPQGTPRNHNFRLSYNNSNIFKSTAFNANLYYQDFRTVYGFNNEKKFKNGGQSNLKSRKKGLRFDFDSKLYTSPNFTAEILYGADVLEDNTAQKLEDGRFWTPNMTMTNIAPFAIAKLDLAKKIVLKAGVRYENAHVKVDDFNTLSRYNKKKKSYTKSVFVEGGDLDYKAITGNIGLRYNVNRLVNIFSSWSQSFTLNELGRVLRESTVSIISKLPTDPVITNNYELGVTGKVSNWLDYEITSYASTSELGASYVTTPAGYLTVKRAPEIIYGFEGYVNIHPTNWLRFGTQYSYMKGKQDKDDNGSYESTLYNNRIMAPRMNTYISVKPIKKLFLQLNMINNFKQEATNIPIKGGYYGYGEGPVSAYTLFNFVSSYKINNNLKLNLGIENLFNKEFLPAQAWWTGNDASFSNAPGMRGTFMIEYKF